MASDEVFEEQHDVRRLPNRPLWVDKFELLEKHIKETNEETLFLQRKSLQKLYDGKSLDVSQESDLR